MKSLILAIYSYTPLESLEIWTVPDDATVNGRKCYKIQLCMSHERHQLIVFPERLLKE